MKTTTEMVNQFYQTALDSVSKVKEGLWTIDDGFSFLAGYEEAVDFATEGQAKDELKEILLGFKDYFRGTPSKKSAARKFFTK